MESEVWGKNFKSIITQQKCLEFFLLQMLGHVLVIGVNTQKQHSMDLLY